MANNKICNLFNIELPIIQAGMVWCANWKLAAAVSNAGGLGLIGAGSMYPEVLREHIVKCKKNALRILTLQRPGKKIMSAQEVLNGWPINKGQNMQKIILQ